MSSSIIAFAIRAGGAGLAFALQAFLARFMAVEEYGQFVLVWTWTLALGSFASLGLAEMALRVLPRYALRARTSVVADFVSHGFRTTAAVAVAASLVALILAYQLPISEGLRAVIVGVCVTLPLLGLDFFLNGVSRAMDWYRLGMLTTYIARPMMIITACAAMWALGVKLTGIMVVVVLALSIALTTIYLRLVLDKRLRGETPKPSSPTLRRFWLKQSMPMLLASGLDDILGYADVVLVGVLLSPAEAALYFVASRVLMPASLVQYAFYYVAARRFSLALVDENKIGMKRDFWVSTALTMAACGGAVILTLLAAPLLLRIFGDGFSNVMPLVFVLSAGHLARAASTQAQEYLMMAGQAQAVSVINGLGVLAMFVSGIFAAPSYGSIGIAWALTIALAVRSLLLLNHANNHLSRAAITL